MPTLYRYLRCGDLTSPGVTEQRNGPLGPRDNDDDDDDDQREKKFDDIFNRLDTIHQWVGETDRRTDRHWTTAGTVLTYSVAR